MRRLRLIAFGMAMTSAAVLTLTAAGLRVPANVELVDRAYRPGNIDFTTGLQVYLAIGSDDDAKVLDGARKSLWSHEAPKE